MLIARAVPEFSSLWSAVLGKFCRVTLGTGASEMAYFLEWEALTEVETLLSPC
jgi:hypothetical protein